jgi:hypothetical protein
MSSMLLFEFHTVLASYFSQMTTSSRINAGGVTTTWQVDMVSMEKQTELVCSIERDVDATGSTVTTVTAAPLWCGALLGFCRVQQADGDGIGHQSVKCW